MTAPVLVAFATTYGSTREVAERVAQRLREAGLIVTLRELRDVDSLEGVETVVLGAPIYIGHLHRDAQRFLDRFKDALEKRKVAVFSLGPLTTDETEVTGSRDQLEQDLAKHPELAPFAVAMLGGSYDPAKLGLVHKLMAAMPSPLHGRPSSDVRDWDAIDAWANELASRLRVPVAV